MIPSKTKDVSGENLETCGVKVRTLVKPHTKTRDMEQAALETTVGKSLALAHVVPAAAKPDTVLHISGGDIDCDATVVTVPIYNPDKSLTHHS